MAYGPVAPQDGAGASARRASPTPPSQNALVDASENALVMSARPDSGISKSNRTAAILSLCVGALRGGPTSVKRRGC